MEDTNYNFQHRYDEDGDVFENGEHDCKYYEISEFKKQFEKSKNNFSTYSHNVRSINGHWDNLLDIFNSTKPIKFSVIALQEIWSVQKNYTLESYGKFEYVTRDMNGPPNPNCGGGVGLFIDSNYNDYEVLKDESFFIPHVYESLWVKIRTKNGKDKIIGNVYRPNTAPRANLEQAIQTHLNILEKIMSNKEHSKCEIQILGDFNVNMLNFETHGLTKARFQKK